MRLHLFGRIALRVATVVVATALAALSWVERAAHVAPADAQATLRKWTGVQWPDWLFTPAVFWIGLVVVVVAIVAQMVEKHREGRSATKVATASEHRIADHLRREGAAARVTTDGVGERIAQKVDDIGEKMDASRAEARSDLAAQTTEIIEAIKKSAQRGADPSGLKLRALSLAGEIAGLVKQWQSDLPSQPHEAFHPGFAPGHPAFPQRELHPEHEVKTAAAFQQTFGERAKSLHAEFADKNLRYGEWDQSLRRHEWPGGIRDVYAAMNGLQHLAHSLPDEPSIRIEIIARAQSPLEQLLIRLSVRLANLGQPPINFEPGWMLEILSPTGERLGGTIGRIEFLTASGTLDPSGALTPLQAEAVYNVQMLFHHVAVADQAGAKFVLIGKDLRGNELRSAPFPKSGDDLASTEDRLAALHDSGLSLTPMPSAPSAWPQGIAIREIVLTSHEESWEPAEIEYTVAYDGPGDIVVLESRVSWLILTGDDALPPKPPYGNTEVVESGTKLVAGVPRTLKLQGDKSLGFNAIFAKRHAESDGRSMLYTGSAPRIFLLGYLTYADWEAGARRTQRFCRKWNPLSERFEIVSDYEYETSRLAPIQTVEP